MVHRYILYNGHGLTIRVNFIVKCVWGGFGSNDFVTKTQPFPMDAHCRTDIISGVGPLEVGLDCAASIMYGSRAMAWAPALYYRSLGIASTLLRRDDISGRPYY
jgi:hypothetical protein